MKKLKKLLNYKNTPFIIFFILMLSQHLVMTINVGDYTWFKTAIDKMNYIDFIKFRYNNWTSRIIIETFIYYIVQLPHIFYMVIDTLFITFILILFSKLFNKENDVKLNYLIIVLMFLYNFENMSTAGWLVTTINYLWPFCFMLISFLPIRKYLYKEKVTIPLKFFSSISLIIACNFEQVACISFGIYFLLLIYMIINRKSRKISFYNIFMLLLIVASIIFILTCPGNKNRITQEAQTYMPEFNNFGLFTKIMLGFNCLGSAYFVAKEYLMSILSILLVLLIYKKSVNKVFRFISLIPFVTFCILTHFSSIVFSILPNLQKIQSLFSYENILYNVTNCTASCYLTFTIMFLSISSIVVSLVIIFKDKNGLILKYFVPVIFLIGMASRIMMGFSPTIFISTLRTNLFFEMAILISILYLFKEYMAISPQSNILYRLVIILGLFRYLILILFTTFNIRIITILHFFNLI